MYSFDPEFCRNHRQYDNRLDQVKAGHPHRPEITRLHDLHLEATEVEPFEDGSPIAVRCKIETPKQGLADVDANPVLTFLDLQHYGEVVREVSLLRSAARSPADTKKALINRLKTFPKLSE